MAKTAAAASLLCAAWLCGTPPALAQPAAAPHPPQAAADDDAQEEGGEAPDGEDRAPQGTGHGRNKGGEGLLGDVGGARPFFARYGITFDASETAETLGNPTGGARARSSRGCSPSRSTPTSRS